MSGDLLAGAVGRLPEHVHEYRCTCGLRLLPVHDAADPLDRLTGRQREVLTVYFEADSRAEAARLLGISPYTLKSHLTAIYRRLGVAHQRQLAWQVWGPGRGRVA